jgi:hypothetical protein
MGALSAHARSALPNPPVVYNIEDKPKISASANGFYGNFVSPPSLPEVEVGSGLDLSSVHAAANTTIMATFFVQNQLEAQRAGRSPNWSISKPTFSHWSLVKALGIQLTLLHSRPLHGIL